MMSSEVLGISSPVFDGGFTPWENINELMSIFQPQNHPANSNSGSDEPNQANPSVDERKQRRMKSNRESARRSRLRKQKHLEGLRNQANRLRIKNLEIANRLDLVTRQCHLLQTDNDRIRSETYALKQKLSDIRQFLLFRKLQHFSSLLPFNTVTSVNEQSSSLIA